MKGIVETIAKQLVEYPEAVQVRVSSDERLIHIELKVHPSDMGKVIGKQGRIARAFRTVLKAIATKEDKLVNLDILENEGSVD